MKKNATLSDFLDGVEHLSRPARNPVPRRSNCGFKAKIVHRSRTGASRMHFWSWVKWCVFLILFCGFIWEACEAVQYLRGMGGK
jgi:hypothetical protein